MENLETEVIKKLDLTLEGLTEQELDHLQVTKWAVLNGLDFLSKQYAADLCEKYALKSKWNKLKTFNDLPKKSGKYLIYGRYSKDSPKNVFQANYFVGDKFRTDIICKDVTHWMQLPDAPISTTEA